MVRFITLFLGLLLVLVQYPLWLGKGGWLRVWDLDHQVETAQAHNVALRARNVKLGAEVADLRDGLQAAEERARNQLGMVKDDEFFVQILSPAMSQNRWAKKSRQKWRLEG